MDKKGQITAISITIMTVVIIIGMIVLNVSSELINTQTITSPEVSDTFVASNTTCVQVTNDCIVTGSAVFANNSDGAWIGSGNFSICRVGTADAGFLLDSGVVDETLYGGSTIETNYTSRSCTQVSGTTRTVITLIPLLIAVALLIFVAMKVNY